MECPDQEFRMLLFVTLLFLQGADMILGRWWIVEHKLTTLEFGAFDRGGTQDGTRSLARTDVYMMTLNWVKSILVFYFP